VPHLRDGFIVDKVGHFRGSENPDTLNSPMPSGLKRFQREGDDHFITLSCYRRERYLATAASKDTFLDSLELTQAPQLRSHRLRRDARACSSPHQRTARARNTTLNGLAVPQTLRLKAPRTETLLAGPLLRFQCLHAQQTSGKVEVHAP
jgi:hypothetical protein